MINNYSFIMSVDTRKKSNPIKYVILIVLIIILVISLILLKIKIEFDNNTLQYAKQIEEESKIIKTEELIALEKERKRLKNSNVLTKEQIDKVEDIYSINEKSAFLTFDDGPTNSVTPFILDYLKKENIKVTFFVLGDRVKANPNLIKREFEEGHYIANHGYTHKYSQIYQSIQNVLDEYNYTEKAIQEALENPDYHSRVFRFPGGSIGGYYSNIKSQAKKFLNENSIASLDWNALTNDAAGANTKEELIENAVNTIGNQKSVVILMHDAADKILTYETLPEIVRYLREKGYVFKNLYDIL